MNRRVLDWSAVFINENQPQFTSLVPIEFQWMRFSLHSFRMIWMRSCGYILDPTYNHQHNAISLPPNSGSGCTVKLLVAWFVSHRHKVVVYKLTNSLDHTHTYTSVGLKHSQTMQRENLKFQLHTFLCL